MRDEGANVVVMTTRASLAEAFREMSQSATVTIGDADPSAPDVSPMSVAPLENHAPFVGPKLDAVDLSDVTLLNDNISQQRTGASTGLTGRAQVILDRAHLEPASVLDVGYNAHAALPAGDIVREFHAIASMPLHGTLAVRFDVRGEVTNQPGA